MTLRKLERSGFQYNGTQQKDIQWNGTKQYETN
jgi:hypothetical protein